MLLKNTIVYMSLAAEETRVHGGNLRRHSEDIQTPQRKALPPCCSKSMSVDVVKPLEFVAFLEMSWK